MFDRFAICEGAWLYDTYWAPTPYQSRLHRIGFRPGASLALHNASSEAKEVYGRLVRKHERLYLGFLRFARRAPNAPAWPGTQNMPNGTVAWLKANGIFTAVLSYVED